MEITLVASFPGSPWWPGNEVYTISTTGITISSVTMIKKWLL